MKIRLQPFVAQATHWPTDEFQRARLKLTVIYVLIVATILAGFSLFLLLQINQQLSDIRQGAETSMDVLISIEEASAIVSEMGIGEVTDAEEEVIQGQLVYTVEVLNDGEEIDVYIDRVTGEVLATDGEEESSEEWADVLINDFEENLWLANGVILLLVTVLSYFLAGWSLRPVQTKLQQHEQFSGDVAHELRTPLSAMLASVDAVLRIDDTKDAYKESLHDVRGETKRLIALTEDLLQTLKGASPAEFETVSIDALLDQVIKRLSSYATDKQVEVVLQKNSPLTSIGNELLLERLFFNVIHNAIKFSQPDSQVVVAIDAQAVSVTDTGVGMSAEAKRRIFDRLYTADTARDERVLGGAGLGMAIVKQIADTHNITVTVESTENQGTCVQLSFLQ